MISARELKLVTMANLMTGYLAARAFFAAFARCRLSNTAANGTLVVLPTWFSPVARWWNDPLSLAFSSSLFPAPVPAFLFQYRCRRCCCPVSVLLFVCTDDPPGSPVLPAPLCRLHWFPNFHPRLTELTTRS